MCERQREGGKVGEQSVNLAIQGQVTSHKGTDPSLQLLLAYHGSVNARRGGNLREIIWVENVFKGVAAEPAKRHVERIEWDDGHDICVFLTN